jgi:hypothetical protein
VAFFFAFFLSLIGPPPIDTPGGPIVMNVPAIHIAGVETYYKRGTFT